MLGIVNKNTLTSILLGAWLFLCPLVSGQTNRTSVSQDTLIALDENIAIDTAKRQRKHSPQIATLSSALVPGLGQIYNQKYWKVPIIWGGGLALYTYYDYNNAYYHRFKLANEQIKEGDPVTDPELEDLPQNSINNYKDYYRRNRDRAMIFMGLLYVANIVDAMVDAHLLDYDISKDLSLHWEPSLIQSSPQAFSSESYALGARVQLRF